MMRAYELMVIIDGDLDDTAAQAWITSITDSITSRWHGPRQARLVGSPAVRLPDQQEGVRLLRRVQLLAPGGALDELERSFRIADDVVRHKLIRLPEPKLLAVA